MDLNELLYHHQVALLQGQVPACEAAGSSFDLAGHYRRRIDAMRRMLGVAEYPDWCREPSGARS